MKEQFSPFGSLGNSSTGSLATMSPRIEEEPQSVEEEKSSPPPKQQQKTSIIPIPVPVTQNEENPPKIVEPKDAAKQATREDFKVTKRKSKDLKGTTKSNLMNLIQPLQTEKPKEDPPKPKMDLPIITISDPSSPKDDSKTATILENSWNSNESSKSATKSGNMFLAANQHSSPAIPVKPSFFSPNPQGRSVADENTLQPCKRRDSADISRSHSGGINQLSVAQLKNNEGKLKLSVAQILSEFLGSTGKKKTSAIAGMGNVL